MQAESVVQPVAARHDAGADNALADSLTAIHAGIETIGRDLIGLHAATLFHQHVVRDNSSLRMRPQRGDSA